MKFTRIAEVSCQFCHCIHWICKSASLRECAIHDSLTTYCMQFPEKQTVTYKYMIHSAYCIGKDSSRRLTNNKIEDDIIRILSSDSSSGCTDITAFARAAETLIRPMTSLLSAVENCQETSNSFKSANRSTIYLFNGP